MKKKKISILRKLMRTLKWLIPLCVIGVIVALALKPKPTEVDIGKVSRANMIVTIDDDGETRVRERYVVSAPLAGQLLRISINPGDEVRQGDVVALIKPNISNMLDPRALAEAEAAVKVAESSMMQAETQVETKTMEVAQREKIYLRSKQLHEKGNIADVEYEQDESDLLNSKQAVKSAQSGVEVAKFQLDQARVALKLYSNPNAPDQSAGVEVRSPINGRVLRVHQESSISLVAGSAIVEIGDPSDLEMRIDILSQDAVRIKPGQKIIINHWGGESSLYGTVRHVEPSAYTKVSALGVDEQRVDVIADFDAKSEEVKFLGDGYRIEASIVIWENQDAVQIPSGALFRKADDWAAYKVDGDRARLVMLKIGRNNGESGEVLEGLSADDQVILHPGDSIEDGTLIIPRS